VEGWHRFLFTLIIIHQQTKIMKSSAKNQELFEEQNIFENTNPFQRDNASASMQKSGKRPRIMKPLYSVRLQ